jgi:hypothetical protein
MHRLFLRNYGELSRLAQQLRISRGTVSRWFGGYITSRRIEEAVHERAGELLSREKCGDDVPTGRGRHRGKKKASE